MKKNLSTADRIVRMGIACVLSALCLAQVFVGTAAILVLAFAAVLLITSLVSFCPLYALLHFSTCKRQKNRPAVGIKS